MQPVGCNLPGDQGVQVTLWRSPVPRRAFRSSHWSAYVHAPAGKHPERTRSIGPGGNLRGAPYAVQPIGCTVTEETCGVQPIWGATYGVQPMGCNPWG